MKMGRRTALKAGAGALAMAPAVVRAQATMKLPLATVWPDANFHVVNCRRFADEVKKATGGAIEIDVKSGGQLGFKGPECLRAVRDGLVPMADYLDTQQIGDEPFLGLEGIPFLAGSADELKLLYKHLRPEWEKITAKNNQTLLYAVPWPNQYLHLKVKVETVDALKGIKIRVADKGTQELWASAGVAPVVIPWGELLPALSSGAVSGVSTSAVSGVDGKFWEFLKFFHETNQTWASDFVTINNDVWKKIKPEHQKAITDLAKKLEPEFWDSSFAADKDCAKKMIDGGMQLVKPSTAMMAELRKRSAHLMDEFLKKVPSSQAPVKAFLAEVKRG
ncbi:TRAP transporter substrate-binding protein [Reyranella sp.]|uniref:TRAP transporter substrate-binding protein n=1 Tax=Reyranella sp. TaxID=1929291 RepID=UPI003D11DE0B